MMLCPLSRQMNTTKWILKFDCCNSQDSFPQDLYNKLERLLAFVKARNARINEALAFLPKVLADMVADYLPPSTD